MGDRVNRLFGKSAQVIRSSASGAIPVMIGMTSLSAPPSARAAHNRDRCKIVPVPRSVCPPGTGMAGFLLIHSPPDPGAYTKS